MASEAGGASVNGATSSTNVPTSSSAENLTADARSPGQPSTKPSKSGNLEQFAKDVARETKPKTQPQAQPDEDEEVEAFGEKIKRSEYQRLKKEAERQQEHIRAANKRFEEAAKLNREREARDQQFNSALQQFKGDPTPLFEAAGMDPVQWAEQQLTRALQRKQMSPEQVQLEQARQEIESLKSQQTKAAEQAKTQKFEAETQRWLQFFDRAIGTALESGRIPRTPHMGNRVRQVYSDLIDAGHRVDDPATAQLATEIARDNSLVETQELLGQVAKESPEFLIELVGGLDGEIVKTIQRLAVARAESSAPKPKPQQPARPAPKPQTKAPPTFEEVRARLGMR